MWTRNDLELRRGREVDAGPWRPAHDRGDSLASRAEGIRGGDLSCTSWTGRRVIGMSDCLWGLPHGVNDAGLAASLRSTGGLTSETDSGSRR
jgi:hypothetical protein